MTFGTIARTLAPPLIFIGCSSDLRDKGDAAGADGGGADGDVSTIEGGGGKDAATSVHRLFVGNVDAVGGGVVAWDGVDQLTQDRAPDVTFFDPSARVQALEVAGDRLFAYNDSNKTLAVFDQAGKLTNGSTPSFALGSTAFDGMPSLSVQRLIHSPPLLIAQNGVSGGVQLFKNPTTLGSTDKAYAHFGNVTSEAFGAAARDPKSDRLFVGELPQRLIQFSNAISGASGQAGPADFGGPQMRIACMAIDDVRLYAFGFDTNAQQATLYIYDLASVHPGSNPDVILNKNLPPQAYPLDCALWNDTLALSFLGANDRRVVVYSGAKSLTAQSDYKLLTSNAIEAPRLRFSKAGLLFVMGRYGNAAGVTIWSDVATSATQRAQITMGITTPGSIALYEP